MAVIFFTALFPLEGQNRETEVTQQSMVAGFILGLIGVYLLLAFQFGSYLEPIVIMVAIPLALIGVILGHLLMGLDISIPSMLGFVSLAGVVDNDSILLVNFAKDHHSRGMPLLDAVGQASRARFLAILLTTTTTVAGLFPVLIETQSVCLFSHKCGKITWRRNALTERYWLTPRPLI